MKGEKKFYMSKRIQGGVVTLVAAFFAWALGVDIDEKQLGEVVAQVFQLAGSIWMLYGGVVATEKIKWRD